jgi:hypothetical protein
MFIKTTARTLLKSRPTSSANLASHQRRSLPQEEGLYISEFFLSNNQHWFVRLVEPVLADDGETKLQSGFLYDGHAYIDPVEPVQLDVPYYSQLDNGTSWQGSPNRQCNLTAHSMLVDYLLRGELTRRANAAGFIQPETLYGKRLREMGYDTTDHEGHTTLLREEFGIESFWDYNLSMHDLHRQLDLGFPVPIGVTYKRHGHIVCVSGVDTSLRRWSVEDPYGSRFGATDEYDTNALGARDPYLHDTLERLFCPEGIASGWGRIVTVMP